MPIFIYYIDYIYLLQVYVICFAEKKTEYNNLI